RHPDEPVVSYNGLVEAPISESEAEVAAAPPSSTPMINMGLGATQGIGNMPPGAAVLGGAAGMGGFSLAGIMGASAMVAGTPWRSFGFLYRAGKHAVSDLTTMRLATINALNTAGANGSLLSLLLQQHGPAAVRNLMLYIATRTDDALALRHTGNLPAVSPSDEFPIFYDANYHLRMSYHSPIAGSRNTVSEKQFTLRYEEPPAYNGGTVLY
ncbi:MAG: hypothetical protein ACK4L7_10750, partial [Flavobacteriales bacterium]